MGPSCRSGEARAADADALGLDVPASHSHGHWRPVSSELGCEETAHGHRGGGRTGVTVASTAALSLGSCPGNCPPHPRDASGGDTRKHKGVSGSERRKAWGLLRGPSWLAGDAGGPGSSPGSGCRSRKPRLAPQDGAVTAPHGVPFKEQPRVLRKALQPPSLPSPTRPCRRPLPCPLKHTGSGPFFLLPCALRSSCPAV